MHEIKLTKLECQEKELLNKNVISIGIYSSFVPGCSFLPPFEDEVLGCS